MKNFLFKIFALFLTLVVLSFGQAAAPGAAGQVIGIGDVAPLGYQASSTSWKYLQFDASGNLLTSASSTPTSDFSASGSITTQNLNPNSGVATAGSTISISSLAGANTVAVQVTGTYTGALTVQGTVDNVNWIAIPSLLNINTGIVVAAIPSAAVGLWQTGAEGCVAVRVTALAAMTGTATVSVRVSTAGATVAIDTPLPAGTNLIGAVGFQDFYMIGQSAQTATVNNILTATAGAAATDATGYQSGSVQVVSTGTGGTFIFEGSNDNVSFIGVPVYNQTGVTAVPSFAAITATASTTIYVFPIPYRYIRLRIATTITGGTIQAYTTFKNVPFSNAYQIVAQPTLASLNATVNVSQIGATAVVTSGVAGIQAIGGNIADGTAPTANPVPVGGITVSTLPGAAIANGLTKRIPITGDNQVIVHQDGDPSNEWQATSGTTALATTTSTALKAAGAAGVRNYVTSFQFYNTSSTVSTTVSILDGATVIWTGYLPAVTAALVMVPIHVELRTPLKGTAATAMNIQLGTTAAAVYYNVEGYQAN